MKSDFALIGWAKSEGLFERIDRKSEFGNPFVIPDDGDRETVCASYEIYWARKFGLHKKVEALRGKVLGCWCYPLACHGDLLTQTLEGLIEDDI